MKKPKATKSKTYLLYYINKYIPIKYIESLLNVYLYHENNGPAIVLIYKFLGKDLKFIEYEGELCNNEHFATTENYDKKGEYVVYVFNMPKELTDVINLFMLGKYSKLPERKHLIHYMIDNYGVGYDHKLIQVIRKDPNLKSQLEEELKTRIPEDNELASIPDVFEETYFNIYNLVLDE